MHSGVADEPASIALSRRRYHRERALTSNVSRSVGGTGWCPVRGGVTTRTACVRDDTRTISIRRLNRWSRCEMMNIQP